jgi:flagellar biogenesis protein FliO
MEQVHYLKALLSLIFVISLIGFLGIIIRKLNLFKNTITPNSSRKLQLLENLDLGQDKKIFLVKNGENEYLIFASRQQNFLIDSNKNKKNEK